jgi:hypothetical protein
VTAHCGSAKLIPIGHGKARTLAVVALRVRRARSAILSIRHNSRLASTLTMARGTEAWIRDSLPDYVRRMPQKPLDLLMKVAKAFVKDMRGFHAARWAK